MIVRTRFARLLCCAALALALPSACAGNRTSSFVPAVQTGRHAAHVTAPRARRYDYLNQGPLLVESMANASTAPNAWTYSGGACLTAGNGSTPSTSIPACGANAPQDNPGSGALQLTSNAQNQIGMVAYDEPLFTSSGLQFTFTLSSFGGQSADGTSLFIADATTGPIPPAVGAAGGALGYAANTYQSGIAGGFIGIGLDEYGGFSVPAQGQPGGPGRVPETVAVRGSQGNGYTYLFGYQKNGKPASLPAPIDFPGKQSRPANAPTFQITLTKTGMLTVAIDRHDGNGFVIALGPTSVVSGPQGQLPAQVYFGFAAATGGYAERHQITNLTVAPAQALGSVLESFGGSSSTPNAWGVIGGACLTAGNQSTPSSSIPACPGTNDPPGSGVLQLTSAANDQYGAVIFKTPIAAFGGIQLVFDYASYGGSGNGPNMGGDGMSLFLSDGNQPLPTTVGAFGGALGYAGNSYQSGLANGYIGIGLDEYGNYSVPAAGQSGGPGRVQETVAARGAQATGYAYLFGYAPGGNPSSLPFPLDGFATRPSPMRTFRVTLTQYGTLTVEIDRHDGNGFVTYVGPANVIAGSQPAVPSQFYFGFASSTGGATNVHAIRNLIVGPPSSQPAPSPAPTPPAYTDWTTNGFDLQHTGYNPSESTISKSNAASLHQLWSLDLGEKVDASPVLAKNVVTSSGLRNMIYVGAESGAFFAIDADAGTVVWSKQLGAYSDPGCYDLLGSPFGITGTAAIDRANNVVYVADGQDKVYALSLKDGTVQSGWPVALPATVSQDHVYSGIAFNPALHLIYASTASYCDNSPWKGQIDAIDTHAAAIVGSFFPEAVQYGGNGSGGGIWGPVAATIDPATNDVFVMVGNADNANERAGYGDAVVRLDAYLTTVKASYSYVSPSSDADFGWTATVYTPPGCAPTLAAGNKDGNLLLFGRDSIGSGPQQIYPANLPGAGTFVGSAAFSPATNLLYFTAYVAQGGGTYGDGITALANSGCTFAQQWATQPDSVPASGLFPLGPPAVANGVVYAGTGYSSKMEAYDAASGVALWNSGSTIGGATFSQPTIDGRLFVTSWDHKIHAFGV